MPFIYVGTNLSGVQKKSPKKIDFSGETEAETALGTTTPVVPMVIRQEEREVPKVQSDRWRLVRVRVPVPLIVPNPPPEQQKVSFFETAFGTSTSVRLYQVCAEMIHYLERLTAARTAARTAFCQRQ